MAGRSLTALLLGLVMGGAAGAGITAVVLVAGGEDAPETVASPSTPLADDGTSDPVEARRAARRMEALEDENRALRRQLRVPRPAAPETQPGNGRTSLQPAEQAKLRKQESERLMALRLVGTQAATQTADADKLMAAIRDTTQSAAARQKAFQALLKAHPERAKELAAEMLAAGETDVQLRSYALYSLRVGAVEGQAVHPSVRAIAFTGGADPKERSMALSIVAIKSPDVGFPALEDLIASPDAKERKLGMDTALSVDTARTGKLFARNINREELRPYVKRMVDVIARHKHKRWSVQQIVGEPDLPIGGDLATAWASKKPEMGHVWVELTFRSAVEIAELRVHETFSAGAIIEISARDDERDEWVILWTGDAAAATTPRWFAPPLSPTDFATRRVKLVLDTDAVKGWNEIDAAELIGRDGLRQWVQSARASSDYTTGK